MDEEQSTSAPKRRKLRDKKYDELTINSTYDIYDVKKLFEKCFIISNAEKDLYTLPNSKSMFKEPSWSHNGLQKLKSELNEVKSRLNDFDLEWQNHTCQMNKASNVKQAVKKHAQPEFLTHAWLKFYEIASKLPLVPLNEIYHKKLVCFRSVHLCEAPGAFVAALNHWLAENNTQNLKWDWLANSLNPYWEGNAYDCMIPDDRFIKHTLQHWCFGEDNTGDIMNLKNLEDLVKRVSSFDVDKQILLVTADGSINCTNMPEEQESVVAQLHLCETVACMHILQKDGNFMLKLFTLFEHQSVCLMYLLSCTFHEVIVIKPATSKGGNSEIYVVCRKFRGKDHVAAHLDILRQHYGKVPPKNAMFSQKAIPESFMQKIEECSAFFKHHQCQIIKDNIRTYHAKNYCAKNYCAEDFILKNVKHMVAWQYITNCKLSPLTDDTFMIVGRSKIKPSRNTQTHGNLNIDSYNERCKKHNLEESLLLLRKQTQLFNLPTEISYIICLPEIVSKKLLKIETGKLFTKIRSSRFSDEKCLHILNTVDILREQEIDTTICFPSAKITREQQEDPNQEILSFQFSSDVDNHKTIIEVYNRVTILRTGQTLTLANYSLLSHLNVGLLYLLGDCFDRNVTIICDNKGCRIRLENYQRNEKVLNYLDEILNVSDSEQKKHRTVWSIIPVSFLEECNNFSTIKEINYWMTKWHVDHLYIMSKI